MNKTDDILERLKGLQPIIDDPDAMTDRIMNSLPDLEPYLHEDESKARIISIRWRWITAAACLVMVIGIGSIWWLKEAPRQSVLAEATIEEPGVREVQDTILETRELQVPTSATDEVREQVSSTKQQASAKQQATVEPRKNATQAQLPGESNNHNRDDYLPLTVPVNEPQIHYAAHVTTDDTLSYQDPARMDEFIANLANFNEVEGVSLDCSMGNNDSTVVSKAYVFKDTEELDLFGRLLQAACYYDSKTPGYLLNISHQQLFFNLKDLRKGKKYLWIAERITGGRILLFTIHSPIEADVSSACYQKYREQMTHTNFSTFHF